MIPTERDALLPSPPPKAAYFSSRAAAVVLPTVFLTQFAIQLPVTTTLDIALQLVCRLYWDNIEGDGTFGPMGFEPTSDRCRVPRVAQIFSTVVTLQSFASACGGFAMFGIVSRLSSKYGNRRVLLSLHTVLLIANALFLGSLLVPLHLRLPMIMLWFVAYIVAANVDVTVLVADMHIVDVTPAEQRTSMLALSIGATLAGGIPAFALGGFITRHFNSPKPVYLLSTTLACILVAYNFFALPKYQRPSDSPSSITLPEGTEGRRSSIVKRAFHSFYVSILLPLGLFVPRRDSISGKCNWRLALCGGSLFMGQLGSGYGLQVVIIYFTTTAGFKPDDNGYVLASAAASSAISLTFITPLLVKVFQPIYTRHFLSNKSALNSVTPSTSFDVCLAIFGWTVDLLVVAVVPYAKTRGQVMLLLVIFGIGSCRTPAGRSIVVASVEPSRSGEALAAAQMVCSVGTVLSTFILGSILSATMTTRPHVVFWTIAAMEASAALLLLCVRDSDRYNPTVDPPSSNDSRESDSV